MTTNETTLTKIRATLRLDDLGPDAEAGDVELYLKRLGKLWPEDADDPVDRDTAQVRQELALSTYF